MSFNKLNLSSMILNTCDKIHYYQPTHIQSLAIPAIVQGKSIIANAETGSGKTATFGLPLIHNLSKDPFSIYAVIIAPSRQLAIQIHQQMSVFGQGMNLRQSLIIGGISYDKQEQQLQNYPHIIVGTPGRIRYMLQKNQKFQEIFNKVEIIVLDEADRLFEQSILSDMKKIIKSIEEIKQMILATATIDENFEGKKLKTILEVDLNFIKYSTFEGIKTVASNKLTQKYIISPNELKSGHLLNILKENPSHKIIVFNKNCKECTLMTETLKKLNFNAICLHSMMKMNQRIANLGKYRNGQVNILVTTDLTSRGLDISQVNMVINYDCPRKISDYIHRVGRTARSGYQGEAITIIDQHEQDLLVQIEEYIGVQMENLELTDDIELVTLYNKTRRQAKINLMSSGILTQISKKSEAKKMKKIAEKREKNKY